MVTDQGWSAHQGWIPYQTASQSAMGTIAQSASQSTMDTIIQLTSQFTMKLLPDQPVSLQWLSFLI
jgi:hypothetical protein